MHKHKQSNKRENMKIKYCQHSPYMIVFYLHKVMFKSISFCPNLGNDNTIFSYVSCKI